MLFLNCDIATKGEAMRLSIDSDAVRTATASGAIDAVITRSRETVYRISYPAQANPQFKQCSGELGSQPPKTIGHGRCSQSVLHGLSSPN